MLYASDQRAEGANHPCEEKKFWLVGGRRCQVWRGVARQVMAGMSELEGCTEP